MMEGSLELYALLLAIVLYFKWALDRIEVRIAGTDDLSYDAEIDAAIDKACKASLDHKKKSNRTAKRASGA